VFDNKKYSCLSRRILISVFLFTAYSSTPSCQTQSADIAPMPPDAPAQWKSLIGMYATQPDTVYIAEKEGRLYLITKRLEYAGLTQSREGTFIVNTRGILNDSTLVFHRFRGGRAIDFKAGAKTYQRLDAGNESEKSFRIKPLKPANELRRIALASIPPKESGDFLNPDLVDVSTLDPTIKFDIRYATTNNFVGAKFYTMAKAFLQRPAAEALLQAHRWLKNHGFGLLIHDAYRPWYVTKMFWDATPDDMKIFVANPSQGSRHNRGCAVDLTLYEVKTGKQVEMTGGYDEMSERSYPGFPGGTSLERWHRDLLQKAMEMRGFTVYGWEWWHFDYKDWKRYPIGTKTFEELAN
jgi:D-alanyl-D-alanine dipeptidase